MDDVYGWKVEAVPEHGEGSIKLISPDDAGRFLILTPQPGMAEDVVREYAGTRVLEAQLEDAARTLVPAGTPHMDLLRALYHEAPVTTTDTQEVVGGQVRTLQAVESPAVPKLRRQVRAATELQPLFERYQQHVQMSRDRQYQRGVDHSRRQADLADKGDTKALRQNRAAFLSLVGGKE